MTKVYIDSEFRCHVSNSDGLAEVELPDFDNKCTQYIEGFRYVPAGESWIREDGTVFCGPMLAPFMDIGQLEACQRQYEQLMEEMDQAWQEGVNSV